MFTPPPVVTQIGNTPLLELKQVRSGLHPAVRVFAKAEWSNPGGSVKDRAGWYMIRQAIIDGRLSGDRRILDATSGNTGIALAMIGAALGIGVTLCIPANASAERKRILAAYHAEVILTDALGSTDSAQATARQLSLKYPDRYCYLNQYANPANVRAHMLTTGPEIWRQTDGKVTHFVAGLGTTGTFTGVGRYLKARAPQVRVFSFQPDGPLHGLEGLKHLPTVHVPEIYDAALLDGNLEVSTEDAYLMMKRLVREEGLFVGVSAAAATVAALRLAATLESGLVVTIHCDTGARYLSLPVWDS
ncbi:cysteine synthase family protein [candidate division KSB1 bacterium]|nr:cysteine synthase family protein [candidate division KSB1 bacterium]